MAEPKPINIKIFGKDMLSPRLAEMSARLKKFSSKMHDAGMTMSEKFTAPIGLAAGAAVHFAMEMNKEMANVATLIPGNISRVQELKENVQQLAMSTGKGTTEITKGLYQVISAYGDSAETAKILELNVKAGAAGMATATESLNLISAVTKAYGDTSFEAQKKVADLSFLAVKLGQTTFPELAGAIGKVTPLAKELGVSQEEMFGIFSTASGVTGDASEVSTQYARVLQSLMQPTQTMSDLFGHLGVESGKDLIAQKGMAEAIKLVVDHARAAKVPLGDLIGQVRGQTLALALAGPQWDTLQKKMAMTKNPAGELDKAFYEIKHGINQSGDAIEDFKQVLIVTGQKIGDKILPYLEALVKKLEPIFIWIQNLSPKTIVWAAAIAGVVAAIGPLLLVIGAITSILPGIVIAWGMLNTVFIASPIGWIVLGIAAIVAGIIALGVVIYKNWDHIKAFFIMIGTAIRDFFVNIVDFVSDKITALLDRISGVKNKVLGFFGFGAPEAGSAAGAAVPMAGAAGAAQAAAEGRQNYVQTNNAAVSVKFENMPKGSKVQSNAGGLDLDIYTGLAFP